MARKFLAARNDPTTATRTTETNPVSLLRLSWTNRNSPKSYVSIRRLSSGQRPSSVIRSRCGVRSPGSHRRSARKRCEWVLARSSTYFLVALLSGLGCISFRRLENDSFAFFPVTSVISLHLPIHVSVINTSPLMPAAMARPVGGQRRYPIQVVASNRRQRIFSPLG